ncbi:MAG: MarR family transcriptional regulator [Anaerolineales bacterium]|nr:MarR family transcriptional regulator [Anaerolineales bacterium]MCL4257438.1 MarR family transcriptional regulator [Anaerolineales bacterium]
MAQNDPPMNRLQSLFERLERLGVGTKAPLKEMQLSLPQLSLLLAVRRTPGIRVNELAQLMQLSAPTVSVGLRKLEDEGWVRREPDPQDKRSFHLYLTDKAKNFAKRVQDFERKQTEVFLSGLNAEEQAQLVHLLDKAITRLEEQAQTKEKQKQ